MTVSAVNNPATANDAAAATNAAGALTNGADFNMFLKLLTVQMQNQDPLDPMDTSEYTQQLVQYSQVEQSVQQTGTLKDILSRLSSQDMAQAAGFIGKEAEFDSTVSGLSDKPAQWNYSLSRNPSSVLATVTDSSGRTVATQTLDASDRNGRFSWNGKLADGSTAPEGAYALSLQALDSTGVAIPAFVRSVGTVQDVTSASGTLTIGVNGVQQPIAALLRLAAQS